MPPAEVELSLHRRHDVLAGALKLQNVCVLHLNENEVFDLAENLPPAWSAIELIGRRAADVLPEPLRVQFKEALEHCRTFGAERMFDFNVPVGGETQFFAATMLRDETGYLLTFSDVSGSRNQDAAMRLLMREVSHRSKNLLAIVQSIAVQTARHSEDIDQFLEKFRGRLYALSSTQDLVTDSDWKGTHFRALLTSQLARLGLDSHTSTTITGDDPVLGPNAALHLGLALHELGANARLYGALAPSAHGTVEVAARLERPDQEDGGLTVEWHEHGLRERADQGVPHFGMMILERVVPLSVGGSAQLSRGENSVDYALTIPANQLAS